MTFKKNDINTIDEAKEYSNYYGGARQPEEKSIFDSNLLKPNGTLDKTLLQDTAQLLNNWREAREKIKKEKMGLSSESHNLLASILKEQKAESIPYQVVNNLNDNKPVDKVISQFEDILFSESDPEFDRKIEDKTIALGELLKKEEEITKEIEKLRKKYSTEIVKKQTDLRNRIVNDLVPKLKDNLRDTGSGDWKILDNMIKSNEEYANRIYRSDISETTKHYGSVIKTGYNGNGKPYTHPIYLTNDLPGQIWAILKDLDKDKLFEYISSPTCTWNDSDKIKFKKTFGQVVDWKNSEFKSGGSSNSMGYFGDSGGSFEFVETCSTHKIDKTIEWNKESVKKEIKHLVMYTHLPKVLVIFVDQLVNHMKSPFLRTSLLPIHTI